MPSIRIGFTLLITALTALFIYCWSNGTLTVLAMKNGPLEWFHLAFLIAASLAFLHSYRTSSGHWKTSAAIMTLGAAAGALREFDFDIFPDVAWLQTIHDLRLHWLALVVVSLPLLGHIVRSFTDIPAVMMMMIKPQSWPFILSVALVGGSMLMDKFYFRWDHAVSAVDHSLEEILEAYGYAFLLFAGLLHRPLAAADGYGHSPTTALPQASNSPS